MNYTAVQEKLNEEARKILLLIKEDFYQYMSPKKRAVIDDLLESKQVVIVNQGPNHWGDNTLAHGGRALKDGKIHFYPDVRGFDENEAVERCSEILPHECFHYFIQPDSIKFRNRLENEMAGFYTEGLVEKEARAFCRRHKDVKFKKANYGYNINFVDALQERLGATDYTTIFSEDDYLRNIGDYKAEYNQVLEQRGKDIDVVSRISRSFPADMQSKVKRRLRNIALQDGNIKQVKDKIKEFDFENQEK